MTFTILWYEFDSFFAFREAFQGMQPINQLLFIIAMIAITIGVLTLVYYLIKFTILLAIEIVKAALKLVESILDTISNEAKAGHRHGAHRRKYHTVKRKVNHYVQTKKKQFNRRSTRRANSSARPAPNPGPNSNNSQRLHCPLCGETFTPEMVAVMSTNSKTFCEYCGNQLEYILS